MMWDLEVGMQLWAAGLLVLVTLLTLLWKSDEVPDITVEDPAGVLDLCQGSRTLGSRGLLLDAVQ